MDIYHILQQYTEIRDLFSRKEEYKAYRYRSVYFNGTMQLSIDYIKFFYLGKDDPFV